MSFGTWWGVRLEHLGRLGRRSAKWREVGGQLNGWSQKEISFSRRYSLKGGAAQMRLYSSYTFKRRRWVFSFGRIATV